MNVITRNLMLALAAAGLLLAAPGVTMAGDNADSDSDLQDSLQPGERCFRFKQKGFDGGGKIKGYFCGIDRDGDGKLYSMSGFLANTLNWLGSTPEHFFEPDNEITRVRITFHKFFGIPKFTQEFDESVTPIDMSGNFGPTAFMGFIYKLDGGPIGDQSIEGLSLSPLAPSVAYVMGPVFRDLLLPPSPKLDACGLGEPSVCAAVQQLKLDGFNVVTVNEAYSGKRTKVNEIADD